MSLRNAVQRLEPHDLRVSPSQGNPVLLPLLIQRLKQLNETLHTTLKSLEVSNVTLDTPIDFYAEVKHFEVSLIQAALQCSKGSQVEAAKLLKLKTTTLNSKIKLYDILWKKVY